MAVDFFHRTCNSFLPVCYTKPIPFSVLRVSSCLLADHRCRLLPDGLRYDDNGLSKLCSLLILHAERLARSAACITFVGGIYARLKLGMDIRRWLDETVLPQQPPSPPEQRSLAPIPRREEPKQAPKQKSRRKRSTSDSSLLDAHPRRRKASPVEHKSDIEESADEDACSDASKSSSRSSGSSTSSQPYARRPRRKTRPERYEPTSKDIKERGTHLPRRGKGESKKTKRKSRRKKAEKPGAGMVQSFHAKNVPRDRLTPAEKLGLFSKGRVSSPVKGRGLPDLVFSEMKFLQKHKGQPEPAPPPGVSKKKRKKDHAHAKEEEISAYFTSVRPALAERDVNIQAKEGASRKCAEPELERPQRERSSVADNAIPTVESSDKAPYLGFGRRGPRLESGSYVSWSESIRAPSGTPRPPPAGLTVNVGQPDSMPSNRQEGDTESRNVRNSQAAPSVTRHVTDGSDGRFQVSSSNPAYQRISRSLSLPKHTSSPRIVNLVDRTDKTRTSEPAASPSSMPPVVPDGDTRGRYQPSQHIDAIESNHAPFPSQKPAGRRMREGPPENDMKDKAADDIEPQSSSSLGRILQECNSSFNDRRRAATSYEADMVEPGYTNVRHRDGLQRHTPAVQRLPSVRFAGAEIIYPPRVPNFSGPSIYQQQAQRQSLAEQYAADENYPVEHTYYADGAYVDEEDDVEDYDQEWGRRPEETLPYSVEDEDEDDVLVEDLVELHRHRRGHGSETVEQGDNAVDSGFWRPHKLY
ncbi:hypothetical protein BDV95DRAFT_100711 [Massariosphaeria phaeospora]|uniref:Uncharacterized protein n=1 Tax=Massariosphaeria phaeospora TaxID=100035 RepID=A0A7C8M986_9PLEO|nr:hypothetical protein BDV95DRAFT_100711 [Massariosphaeria phaeospora]